MSYPLSRKPTYQAAESDFHGIKVVVALDPSDSSPFAVEADSIRNALGHEYTKSSQAHVAYHMMPATLVMGGRSYPGAVVPFAAFFKFCMQHPSPRLDAFREHLTGIAVEVQSKGSYHAPDAPVEAFIPPELEGTETGRWLVGFLHQSREIARVQAEQGRVRVEIDKIKEQIEGAKSEWPIVVWLRQQGRSLPNEEMASEGGRLGMICRQRGISVSDKRVCHGHNFPARLWPYEAIKIWWPDCCRRWGWPVTWEGVS